VINGASDLAHSTAQSAPIGLQQGGGGGGKEGQGGRGEGRGQVSE
jgi:hypothetical protein